MFETFFKYSWEFYQQGYLRLSSPLSIELKLMLLFAASLFVGWQYRRTQGLIARQYHRTLWVLRTLTVGILLFMLMGPTLRFSKETKLETSFVVMLDTSRSMTLEDSLSGDSRFQAARRFIGDEKSGLVHAFPQVNIPKFSFSNAAKHIEKTYEISPDGEYTNLFHSIRDVDHETHAQRISAFVLVSDGGSNSGGSPLEMARHLKSKNIRLYTVGIGNPSPPDDYEIVRIAVPRQVRRNTQIEAFVTIRCTGFRKPFSVLLRQGEAILSTLQVQPEPDRDIYQVRFTFYPEQSGSQKYTLYIKPVPEEKMTTNNQREFEVDVTENRLPILYIEGSPRTEFRFLRRALFRDTDFRLVSIVRVANKPVRLYTQNAEDMPELKQGFPTTKEQLYKFEALFLGDIEASFFTQEQLRLIEDFVKERGGGFAMLGGVNSFNLGGYRNTPIEALLPVVMKNDSDTYSFERFHIHVPPTALKHPILHQNDDSEENQRIWDRVPELQGYNLTLNAKPAAQVLATHARTKQPILAVQNYGRGRTASFCTGGSWAWRMSVSSEDEIQEKFWRQLIRWLAVGSKENISVCLDRDIYAKGDCALLRATVLGSSLEAVNEATVKCKIQDPFGNSLDIEMPWILTEEGVYQCRYEIKEHGDHKVTVYIEMPNPQSAPTPQIFEIQTHFPVAQLNQEFNHAEMNESLLQHMAELTGGKYFSEKDAAGLIPELQNLQTRTEKVSVIFEEKDLWDAPIFFMLIITLLGCEWALRKRVGLA